MTLRWDMSKPIDINEKTWRRMQIMKYVERNVSCKPKDILSWISSHDPHPWPYVTIVGGVKSF